MIILIIFLKSCGGFIFSFMTLLTLSIYYLFWRKFKTNSKLSLNEVFNGYKHFKDQLNLARTIIDTIRLFMKNFDKLIIRLCGQFTFNRTLYLKYSPESLKSQFCISNVLVHLFFCNRSPNSNEGNCRLCSRLFVNDASGFFFN